MKAFISHNSLGTKREAKAPRRYRQLKIKRAVANCEKQVLNESNSIHQLLCARQSFWPRTGVEEAVILQGSHQTVNVPSDLQAGCALLQAWAAATVLWPLLGTHCCNHSRKFEKSGDFLFVITLSCCSCFLRTRLTLSCCSYSPTLPKVFNVWHVTWNENVSIKQLWKLSFLNSCNFFPQIMVGNKYNKRNYAWG